MVFQGMLEDIDTKDKVACSSYNRIEQLDFQIMLADNYYVNQNSIHICFPLKIKKASDKTGDIETNMITVNNIFGHLVKEISITRYGHNKQLTPTSSPYETYQHSDAMLKHLPKDSLKKLEKTLLHSKQPVYFNKTTIDRRTHNETGANRANDTKDLNTDERITKLH